MKRKISWETILTKLRTSIEKTPLPSVSTLAEDDDDPFRVLVSTLISLRTKDEVTLKASLRLFKKISSPRQLATLSEAEIEQLIYPAGFYKTKAKNLKAISGILVAVYAGRVPADEEKLLALPGVGRKTANLVLNLGYGMKAICVDTHVHRISNRLGWVRTKTPEETEYALMEILPDTYWIEINELLVRFGQQICRPIGPFCSRCPVSVHCPRVGVKRSR